MVDDWASPIHVATLAMALSIAFGYKVSTAQRKMNPGQFQWQTTPNYNARPPLGRDSAAIITCHIMQTKRFAKLFPDRAELSLRE